MVKNGCERLWIAGLGLVLLALAAPAFAAAADCDAIYKGIVRERSLMRKKGLVKTALEVCPNSPGIVYQYGYAFERFRKYKEALKYYRKAIRLDHNYAKAYFGIGDVQMLLDNYREAADSYKTGLLYAPDDSRARNSLKDALARYKEVTGKDLTPTAAPPKVTVAKVVKKRTAPPSVLEAPILRLRIPFDGTATTLAREAKDVLDVVVGQAMTSGDLAGSRLEVIGYTDNTGDAEQNMKISRLRAEAVRNYLISSSGIRADRLVGVYRGSAEPVVPNDSSENRQANRRVEFKIVK